MELLVVIGIIALLAAILLPAIRSAFVKAEKSQAQSDIKSLETACKAYVNEYSRFPSSSATSNDKEYSGNNQAELIYTLRDISTSSGENQGGKANPRHILFLEISDSSLGPKGTPTEGAFIDPWDKPYFIKVDDNFDHKITPSAPYATLFQGRSVLVWSGGPDGNVLTTNDNLTSWSQ